MFFKFYVPGWLNTQVVEASSVEDAEEKAEQIGKEFWGLTQIPEDEYREIRASW